MTNIDFHFRVFSPYVDDYITGSKDDQHEAIKQYFNSFTKDNNRNWESKEYKLLRPKTIQQKKQNKAMR